VRVNELKIKHGCRGKERTWGPDLIVVRRGGASPDLELREEG
jgi:hypothetical protein